MTTNANPNSDLRYAPPNFKGHVFADFISAHYHIVFDLSLPIASVTSTIRFETEDGAQWHLVRSSDSVDLPKRINSHAPTKSDHDPRGSFGNQKPYAPNTTW